MKSRSLHMAGVALALAAVCGQAVAGSGWGRGYHGYNGYHGYRGGHYSHGGYHSSSGAWIGGAIALAAIGTIVAVSSRPVYAAPPARYAPEPLAQNGASNGPDIIAYPAKGQDFAKQGQDRFECHNWAMNQSGFDPAYVTQWTTSVMVDSYGRAVGACMQGRGYSLG